MFEIDQHWLVGGRGVRHCPSPNFDERPAGDLSLIVVHNISLPPEVFGGPEVEAFFSNNLDSNEHPFFQEIGGLKVSAHLFIRRDGEIVQFVGFDKRAWHAGASCFEGRDNCNDYSIGIELEGADHIPYESIQYEKLAQLCDTLIGKYPTLSSANICGHSDIAPGRKTDPGPSFDWTLLRRGMQVDVK